MYVNIETVTETLCLATQDHISPGPGEEGFTLH